ncbi:MAG: hypothetical protein IPK83_21330 [Planctomycetes bacterium]|nr:hypothetical protein [Planctomycetota bacterium]
MMYTETRSQSYTVIDIGKAIDCFAADLDMTSQATGLLTRDGVKNIAADVKAMAQGGYLLEANIVLHDMAGVVIRAAKYQVALDAGALTAQRPGNNLWPRTPGGELTVVVRYSSKWKALSYDEQQGFKQSLNITWGTSSTDLSFPLLSGSADRNYVSNGWGLQRTVYK